MKRRISSLLIVLFLVAGCGSSGSVYQLPESQQQGLTYQTYQESPTKAFEAVETAVLNYKSKMLMEEGWEITSSNAQSGTIETNWRQAGGDASVSGGGSMGGSSDERYKLNVEISEAGSGSKVMLKLKKQVKMSQWRTFDVKKKTARSHLQPLFEKIKSEGLTMQS